MPVRKFRSVAEMPPMPPRPPLDPKNLQLACELAELALRLGPYRRFPPGVKKFRSMAEANRYREEWEEGQRR
jgi:hypothetical protein